MNASFLSFLSLKPYRKLQFFGLFVAMIALSIFSLSCGSSSTAQSLTVTIEGFQFTPAEISVKKGSTVTFINKDATPHTADPDSGDGFVGTGRLRAGESKEIAFNSVGTQAYHCAIHPSMMGKVIVE